MERDKERMNISLTNELEQFVNNKVNSGMYHSASEVIREGLRLLREQDELKRARLEELRREIMIGVEQAKDGNFTVYKSGEELIESIKTQGRKALSKQAKGKK